MKELIVGGTAGVGLQMSKQSYHQGKKVIATGTEDVEFPYGEVREFDFHGSDLVPRIGEFVRKLPPIRTLIYTTLYNSEGKFLELKDEDDDFKFNVGLRGLHFFAKKLAKKQGTLEELIAVISAPHGHPRKPEAARDMIRGGAKGWVEGIADEGVIKKALIVEPAEELDSYIINASEIAGRITQERQKEYRVGHLAIGNPIEVKV